MKEIINKLKRLYPDTYFVVTIEYVVYDSGTEKPEYRIYINNKGKVIHEYFNSFQSALNYVNSLETNSDTLDQLSQVVSEFSTTKPAEKAGTPFYDNIGNYHDGNGKVYSESDVMRGWDYRNEIKEREINGE